MKIRSVEAFVRSGACVPVASVVGLLCLATISIADAGQVTIESGTDCWTTPANSSTAHIQLPAGFVTASGGRSSVATTQDVTMSGDPACPQATCGACAAPTITWTDRHGNPVQPGDQHAVTPTVTPSTVDTCVRRNTSCTVTASGPPAPVEIEILCLQLTGTMVIPMSPAPNCTYTVKISLSGSQSKGGVKFTPSSDPTKGTVRLDQLPVAVQATFIPVTSGCNAPLTPLPPASPTFANTTGTYAVPIQTPTLSNVGLAVLVVGLLLGMTIMMWRRHRGNAEA